MPLKKIIKKGQVYHVYYRRKGGYAFLAKHLWKFILGLGFVGALLWSIDKYVFSLADFGNLIIENFSPPIVLFIFYLAEICVGALPPYIFLLWAKEMADPYTMVLFITLTSMLGGTTSYFIGTRLYRLPRVKSWVDVKFKTQFEMIKKFGGLLVFISAISPIPYPTVSMIAGVVKLPFRTFLIMSLGRFIKFFGYSFVLFNAL